MDYGDKPAAAKRSLLTPPRSSLLAPPLTDSRSRHRHRHLPAGRGRTGKGGGDGCWRTGPGRSGTARPSRANVRPRIASRALCGGTLPAVPYPARSGSPGAPTGAAAAGRVSGRHACRTRRCRTARPARLRLGGHHRNAALLTGSRPSSPSSPSSATRLIGGWSKARIAR